MMVRNKFKLCALALLGGMAAASQMEAVTVMTTNWGMLSDAFTDSGLLANQGTVLEATFTLSSASMLTIYTDSYGGGKNADGSTAAGGGFMPSLTLYSGSGQFVAGETFPSPIGNIDPATGLNGDGYIKTSTLATGSYILALSDFLVQQPPTATNLSDGFTNLGSGTTFSDVQGNPRTGNYTINIMGAGNATAVPEPSTWLLTLLAALGTIIFRFRKQAPTIKTDFI